MRWMVRIHILRNDDHVYHNTSISKTSQYKISCSVESGIVKPLLERDGDFPDTVGAWCILETANWKCFDGRARGALCGRRIW